MPHPLQRAPYRIAGSNLDEAFDRLPADRTDRRSWLLPNLGAVERLPPHSCRQPLIQFRQQRVELVAEEGMGAAEAAALAEPTVLEVIGLNRERCRDVLGHAVEPFALLARELRIGVLL